MQCVLIIRAEPAASATARNLEESGFRAVKFPLFEFQQIDTAIPDESYCGVVLTSSNALKGLEGMRWKPADFELPVYCVGSKTEEAARAYGLKNINSFKGDRALLIQAVCESHAGAKEPILYPAAKDRAFDLSEALAVAGITTRLVEVYAMKKIHPGNDAMLRTLADLNGGFVLVHSNRSAAYFFELIDQSNLNDLANKLRFVAISEQAAEPLFGIREVQIKIANEPNEKAMIELLGDQS